MPAAPPTRRKTAPRLIDIAHAAGVGIATVNRVLNDSGKASASTREKVISAARQLGARRLMPEVHRGLTRFDFVFARSQTPFFQRLEIALTRHMQLLDRRIAVHRHAFDPADEKQIAAFIKKPPHKRNGLIVVVRDTPTLRDAVQHVIKQGVPVVTLMSDLSDVNSLHYAGINNLQAGRSAAYFLGRLCPQPGRVLVLTNDLHYRAHRDRSNGFLSVLQQRFAHLDCLAVQQVRDDTDLAFAAVDSALQMRNAAPLMGIYNSGAGSHGIAQALRKHTHNPVWIGHELTDEHRSHLVSGAMDLVIDQDPDGQILSGMQYLLHANKWLDQMPTARPTDFRLYCAENITHQAYLPEAAASL
jgi:LacI family transcriptional regulator